MRTTIDFGIDLGTTNSALAVSTAGSIQIIRTITREELTPSVVRVENNGTLTVGRPAYKHRIDNADNTQQQFKRLMGRGEPLGFKRSGRSMTPVELSAEVLKSLREDARRELGEELTAAVVTVPAMFEQQQYDATSRAASLAGITQHVLLQEPIAAALAYSSQAEDFDGFVLVYDLGGGTFDCSILRSADGRLSVVEHGGDNFTGGKDIDGEVVDWLKARLRSEFGAPEIAPRSIAEAKLFGFAEEAKIQLSAVESTTISIEGLGPGMQSFEAEVELSRSQLEAMTQPLILKTIAIIEQTVQRARLQKSDFARTILVGGPTLMPLTRRLMTEAMGKPPAFNVDPMTVVARGAAVFAASQPLQKPRKPISGSSRVRLNLSFAAASQDTEATVGGRVETPGAGVVRVSLTRADGGWSSGQIPLDDGAFFTSVVLQPRCSNEFHIHAQNQAGTEIGVDPESITIMQGPTVDAAPLPRSLRLGLADNSTLLILPRGTPVPYKARTAPGAILTARAVQRGDPGLFLHMPLLEGESEKADRNRKVGEVAVSGASLQHSLPKDSEIEVELEVGSNFEITMRAYVPQLDHAFEGTCRMGADKPQPAEMEADVQAERRRMAELAAAGGKAAEIAAEIDGLIPRALAGDGDAAEKARRAVEELRAEVDELEKAQALPTAIAGWEQANSFALSALRETGTPLEKERLDKLTTDARAAQTAGRAAELKKFTEEAIGLGWTIRFRQDSTWVDLLRDLAADENLNSQPRARALLEEGRLALDRGDGASLRTIVRQLWDLLPPESTAQLRYASDIRSARSMHA